jgi:SAM-dependent methyltransferase
VPDAIFADPRLARLYDPLDPDRSDLDHYLRRARELGATSVLDVGCGTGTFALLLAADGIEVTGLDPAAASLDVARSKPGAERVRWMHGEAKDLPPLDVDLATMTGNVAQVFLHDDEFCSTLSSIRAATRPGGRVVFEVRDPGREAWRTWNREASHSCVDIPGIGTVESWVDLTEVNLPFVSFRWTYRLGASREVITSDSTLRFRSRTEVEACAGSSGLRVIGVEDAPDRPGAELVFICER